VARRRTRGQAGAGRSGPGRARAEAGGRSGPGGSGRRSGLWAEAQQAVAGPGAEQMHAGSALAWRVQKRSERVVCDAARVARGASVRARSRVAERRGASAMGERRCAAREQALEQMWLQQERAGTGVDAARAGGVTLTREWQASQAALERFADGAGANVSDAERVARACGR
jgi:hypothetical protein